MPRNAPRLAVSVEEYQQRLGRLRQWMAARDIDLLVLTKPELYNYFSGYDPTSTFYLQALLVSARPEDVTLLVNKAEHLLALETTWVEDVRIVWTHEDHAAAVKSILVDRGWDAPARVGLNLASFYLSAAQYLQLSALFPGAEIVDVTADLDDMRLVKSPAEIDYLRRAAHVADLGVTAGINAIRAGVHDREVLAAIQHDVFLNGGEFPAYPTLVDARGTLHGTPTGRALRAGDVIYLEVSGVVRRYHCNISRTVVIGEPSEEVRTLYRVVREALERGTEALRPGARVSEVMKVIEACHAGYVDNTWGRVGFSMEIAYPPIWIGALSLMKGDDHVIEPGMVITMEPGLSYSAGATMMLGNNVLVTEHGPEVLNNVPSELFVR